MVIDGKSLVHALVGECRPYFGELALRCRAVVCCRMSPMQKAEVNLGYRQTKKCWKNWKKLFIQGCWNGAQTRKPCGDGCRRWCQWCSNDSGGCTAELLVFAHHSPVFRYFQAANVGIGISGEEGLQAASASDYAIPRFHFLRRLLLASFLISPISQSLIALFKVHGAWNHDRSVKVILYSFYKNICLYIIELWSVNFDRNLLFFLEFFFINI